MKLKSLLLVSITASSTLLISTLMSSMLPLNVMAEEKAQENADLPTEGLEAEVKKDFPKAVSIYRAALVQNPNNPVLWKRISVIEYSLKHYDASADALKQAIKLQPKAENYQNLSQIYATADKPKEALEASNKLVDLNPTIENLKDRADLANWSGDVAIEKDSYNRMLKLDPNNKDAINGLKRIESQKSTASQAAPATIEKPVKTVEKPAKTVEKPVKTVEVAAPVKTVAKNEPTTQIAEEPATEPTSEPVVRKSQNAKPKRARRTNVYIQTESEQYYDNTVDCSDSYIISGDADRGSDCYSGDDYCLLPNQKISKKTLLERARFHVSKDQLDDAASDYRKYLRRVPNSKEARLEYTQVLRWKGDTRRAEDSLETYRLQFGETFEYKKEQAILLVATNRPKESLCVLKDLLAKKPNDNELLNTKALALNDNKQLSKALRTHAILEKLYPANYKDNFELERYIRTPIRSNIAVGTGGSHDKDGINIRPSRVVGQYFINPETNIDYGVSRTLVSVDENLAFATIDGQRKTRFDSEWIGIMHQVMPELKVGAQGGAIQVKNHGGFGTYKLSAIANPIDRVSVDLRVGRDIYALSPLATSLKIKESYKRASVNWEPWTQRYIKVSGERSHYSDGNRSRMLSVAPSAGVLRTQHIMLDLGLRGTWEAFKNQPANGYYAPKSSKAYHVTTNVYIAQSDNIGYTFAGAAGVLKDDSMSKFGFSGEATIGAIFGIYTDWQLELSAGAARSNGGGSLLGNGQNYYSYIFDALLTRRF